jgi:hypothetical protein
MHHMNSWDRRADGVSGQLRNGRRVKEIDGRQTLQSEQQSVFFFERLALPVFVREESANERVART